MKSTFQCHLDVALVILHWQRSAGRMGCWGMTLWRFRALIRTLSNGFLSANYTYALLVERMPLTATMSLRSESPLIIIYPFTALNLLGLSDRPSWTLSFPHWKIIQEKIRSSFLIMPKFTTQMRFGRWLKRWVPGSFSCRRIRLTWILLRFHASRLQTCHSYSHLTPTPTLTLTLTLTLIEHFSTVVFQPSQEMAATRGSRLALQACTSRRTE